MSGRATLNPHKHQQAKSAVVASHTPGQTPLKESKPLSNTPQLLSYFEDLSEKCGFFYPCGNKYIKLVNEEDVYHLSLPHSDDDTVVTSNLTTRNQSEKTYAMSKFSASKERELRQLRTERNRFRKQTQQLKEKIVKIQASKLPVKNQTATLGVIHTLCDTISIHRATPEFIRAMNSIDTRSDFRCSSEIPAVIIRHVVKIVMCTRYNCNMATVEEWLNNRQSVYCREYEKEFTKVFTKKGIQISPFPTLWEMMNLFGYEYLAIEEVVCPTDEPSQESKLICFFSKAAMIVVDLINAESWDQVIYSIVRSITLTSTPVLIEKLLGNVSNLEKFVRSRLVSFSPPANQNLVDDIRDVLRTGVGLNEKIKEIPLLSLLDEVMCLSTFFWFGDQIPESKLYRNILERNEKVHHTDSMSLISRLCSVADTALMIVSTLCSGVDYSCIVNPLNIELRLGKLLGYYKAYESGNLDVLDPDQTTYTVESYEKEVCKLADDIKILVDKKAVKPAAMATFNRFLATAFEMKSKILIKRKSRMEKDAPYFVGLYGKPGVGKTAGIERVKQAVATAHSREIRHEHVWAGSSDPNGWDTGADSSKLFLAIMEHDNIKRQDGTGQTFFNIANLADTVPSAFNKPDLETKAFCFNFLLGGAVCCNQQDFGIIKNVSSAGAVKRRVDFFEMSVKEEYGSVDKQKGETHLRPDPKKIPMVTHSDGTVMPFQDIHWIQEYTFVEVEIVNDKTGVSRSTKILPIGPRMTDSEWSTLMTKRARAKIHESRAYNEQIDDARNMDHCRRCSNIRHYCKCLAGFKTSLLPSEQRINYSQKLKNFYSDTCSYVNSKFTHSLTLSEVAKDSLIDRCLECTKNENLSDYGFYGEAIDLSSSFCLNFGSWFSYTVCGILTLLMRGFCTTSLHSVFNLRTSVLVSLPFMFNPLIGISVFTLMYVSSCCVNFVTNRVITGRVVGNLIKGVTNRYWSSALVGVGLISAVAVGVSMFKSQADEDKEDEFEITSVDCPTCGIHCPGNCKVVNNVGIDPITSAEVKERVNKPDIWLQRKPIDISTPRDVRNATQEQVKNIVDANTGIIKYNGNQIKVLFVTGCAILVPVHDDELVVGNTVPIHRPGTEAVRLCQIVDLFRIKSDGKDTDMCVATLNTRFMVRNILQYFDTQQSFYYLGTELGGCKLFASETHHSLPFVDNVSTEARKFKGLAVPIQNSTRPGDCGSVLIRNECPCVILGMHVSVSGGIQSNCVIVTRSHVEELLRQCTLDQNVIFHENVFMDNCLPDSPKIENGEASPRVATRFLRLQGDECTTTPPSVVVMGHDVKTRITKKSEVELTSLSTFLEAEGIPRLHGPPPLNANRAFAIAIQHGARGARPRGYHISEAIKKHYAGKVSEAMTSRKMSVSMLTYHDAMHGIFNNRYAKPTALNKAHGGGVPGKKRVHTFDTYNYDLDIPGYDFDDDLTVESHLVDSLPTLFDEEGSHCAVVNGSHPLNPIDAKPRIDRKIRSGVQHITSQLLSGKSMNVAVWAALKDDPTLLSKIELGKGFGRVVTSVAFEMHVFDTIILGELLAHLRTIPLVTGCYEGISFLSEDFNDIAHFHMDFPIEPDFIDGDTTKMDLSMGEQEIRDCFDCMAMIARECGCSVEHYKLIRARGRDLALPVLNVFGEWVSFSMNTSGNKATITINNIAGVQMRTREAWIAMKIALDEFDRVKLSPFEFEDLHVLMDHLSEEECAFLLLDFEHNVRVGSVGDDSLISTICRFFTMEFICGYFKSKGVNITGSSKTSEISGRQRLNELSCCQRAFRWSDELQRIVGPLSLTSLSRSLHCRVPSSVDSDLVEQDVVTNVKEELWFHGKEVYEKWTTMIDQAILSSGRRGIHSKSFGVSYETMAKTMMERFPTSNYNLERSDRTQCLFLDPGNSYEGLTNQQVIPARVVHNEYRLPLSQPMMREGHVRNENGISSDLDPGPKLINTRISETPNTNTSGSEVVHNINFHIPESAESGFMYPSAKTPRVAETHDSLLSMIERPIKLLTLSWSVGDGNETNFDPWETMITNELVKQRMEYHRFFRGNLRIKVLVDGTPFHAGLMWVTYVPMWATDEITKEVESLPDFVEISQRPRVTINPRDSQGGEMLLPFIYTEDYVDLTDDSIRFLGKIHIHTVSPLMMVNNENTPVVVTILGYLEDVELSTPTNNKIIVTRSLTTVNQNLIEAHTTMAVETSRNLAPEDSMLLRTDPAIMMASSSETSVAKLGSREAFIGQFIWNSSDSPDSVICSSRCSPFHGLTIGEGPDTEYHVTPSAWVGLPFEYWRGTCKMRVEVICSAMHKGKLMISWDPKFTTTSGDYNRNYITIMDIGKTTEHIAKTGWGCSLPYLPTIAGMSQLVNCSATEYTSPVEYASGVLTVSVFSPLLVPAESALKSVQVNIYSSMCEDYELVLPRFPLAYPLLNNVPEEDDAPDQVPNPSPSNAISPAVTTTRAFTLCEVPALLLLTPQLPISGGGNGYVGVSLANGVTDLTMDNVKAPNGPYRITKIVPRPEEYGSAIKVRDFDEGPTLVKISAGTFNPPDVVKELSLGGIGNEGTVEFPATDDGNDYDGWYEFNNSSQIFLQKFIYHIPPWAQVTLRPTPNPDPLIYGDLNPFVFFENLDGAPVSNNNLVNRSGVRIGFRLPPNAPKVLSNFVVSYTLTSGGGLCFVSETSDPNDDELYEVLLSTGSGEARHAALNWGPQMRIVVPEVLSITLLSVTYLTPNTTATRSTIKNLPVTNQNLPDESPVMYGPSLPANVDHDFFQAVVRDILYPLKIPSTFMEFKISDPGNPVAVVNRGFAAFKIMHFPLRLRTQINGTNVYEVVFSRNLFEYFTRAFVGMRGSMNVIVRNNNRFGNFAMTWGKATRCRADLAMTSAQSSAAIPDPSPPAGGEYFNMRYNNEARLTIPWFNRKRFALPRSAQRENHNDYAVRFGGGVIFGEKVSVDYSIGPDFSIGHFLSTPILTVV